MPPVVIQIIKRGIETVDERYGPCITDNEARQILGENGYSEGADGTPGEWVGFDGRYGLTVRIVPYDPAGPKLMNVDRLPSRPKSEDDL